MTHPTDIPTNGVFAFVYNGYDDADLSDLTTAEVEHATVYGRHDETIGRISALKVGADGQITDAVVEVGGFLGLGTHSVLVPFRRLSVLRENGGNRLRINLDTTRAELEALPAHRA